MSKQLQNILKEIDSLDAFADEMKTKARRLRNQLLHFNGGAVPKGKSKKRISVITQVDIAGGLKRSMTSK